MLPELLVHALTGATMGERTSAGTTALVDIATGDWSPICSRTIGVDPAIMPKISPATTYAGTWRGIPVHLVGGHDTASAVAALPSPAPNAAFISSGTWMLVGAERDAPDTSDAAMRANFSNEPGVFGNVRFLKNVMGLWMLEQCRARWDNPPLDDLLAAAAALPAGGPTVDATDARFLAPTDMEAEVRAAAACLRRPAVTPSPAASSTRSPRLQRPSSTSLRRSPAIGRPRSSSLAAARRNGLLNELIAEATNIRVRVGPTEATAPWQCADAGHRARPVRVAGQCAAIA